MERFTIPELATEPEIMTPAAIEPARGRVLLLVVAHADDPAFFAGGTLALWADAGWRIVCLRVTDDRWDSVGLEEAETIRRNAAEFRAAAAQLGIAATEDLGWATDVLGDASRVALRERIVHAIRRHRPYGLVTFDPQSAFYEDNLDHRVVAEAVDEAWWCAQFDKHCPEHLAGGLREHAAFERWYFGRTVLSVSHVFDTSSTLERQLDAILRHPTMLANIARQLRLQADTAGIDAPLVDAALAGDHRPLFETLLRGTAAAKAEPFGLTAAETFRLRRSGIGRLAHLPAIRSGGAAST